MAIPEAYTNNVGNLAKCFQAIRTAGVPDRVTFEFLKTLGFTSSNDRPIISILKGIGFLDGSGTPTAAYRSYRDHTRGPRVLAGALRTAYSDLFLANTKAHELSQDKLQGIIAAKISKGEAVVKLIAATFKALAKIADFSEGEEIPDANPAPPGPGSASDPKPDENAGSLNGRSKLSGPGLHYNIQIHLPTTTDISVYNAIFKSLMDHLL